MSLISISRALLGLAVLLGIAFLVSNNKKQVRWRTVGAGLTLQLILGIFLIRGNEMGAFFAPLAWPKAFFSWVSSFFVVVLQFTSKGSEFVFGRLAYGPPNPESLGVVFAFQILPTVIFFASLMSVLYYVGFMQAVVKYMAIFVTKFLGTSGAESLSVVSNIFVGQTEAPLVVKPFIKAMTHSELMAVMVGGMATIAGGVMAAYIQMLGGAFARANNVALDVAQLQFAEHLLGASVMAAPAALVLAKIMFPETGQPATAGKVTVAIEKNGKNVIDAAASGAADGLKLAANIAGMLIAFVALIAMVNYFIGWVAGFFGMALTLEQIFGWVLAPIAWLIGVPGPDVTTFGSLLGTKIVLNEFVAYLGLADVIQAAAVLPKSTVMMTYAFCGFANFSSIAIQIGGIGPLAPGRTGDLATLGLRAVLGGTLANLMTATIAGAFMS